MFRRFARWASGVCGGSWAFLASVAFVLVWAVTGPFFHFSDTWQLIINTVTSIITFLMVFIIQNTQNRDAKAIQLKLDELIRAVGEARTELVNLEERPDEELDNLKDEFRHQALEVGQAPEGPTGAGPGVLPRVVADPARA